MRTSSQVGLQVLKTYRRKWSEEWKNSSELLTQCWSLDLWENEILVQNSSHPWTIAADLRLLGRSLISWESEELDPKRSVDNMSGQRMRRMCNTGQDVGAEGTYQSIYIYMCVCVYEVIVYIYIYAYFRRVVVAWPAACSGLLNFGMLNVELEKLQRRRNQLTLLLLHTLFSHKDSKNTVAHGPQDTQLSTAG